MNRPVCKTISEFLNEDYDHAAARLNTAKNVSERVLCGGRVVVRGDTDR